MIKMGKLKTILLQSPITSLAPDGTHEFQDELIAEEDMKIVAVSFHAIHSQGGNNYMTLQRGGQQRMLQRYHDGYAAVDNDDQIAACRLTFAGPPDPSTASIGHTFFPFPSPHYFEVEEGERIYLNGRLQNDDTNTHTLLAQCLVYYY
ncbi:hypothetical protein ES705_43493 [subsurface metagenome]